MIVPIVNLSAEPSPSPSPRPYGHVRTWDEFVEDLKPRLAPFIGLSQSDDIRSQLHATIEAEFATANAAGELFEVADGMRVVGGAVRFNLSQGTMVWRTAFTRSARWRGQGGDVQPLGYFEGYDLYIGFQGSFPPTLIARHGHKGYEYSTANPSVMGRAYVGYTPYFAAALARADFTGVDLRC